jgi:Glyoxalase-like domain
VTTCEQGRRPRVVLGRRWCPPSRLLALELDHVLIAVADLAVAARETEARYGLVATEGGRHPGWGTANRIVPLGEAYLELVAVVDDAEAAQSPFGRWVAGACSGVGEPLGWAVRTHDIDAVARRLGLTVRAGSRVAPGGELLRWRTAGVEEAAVEPSLPFFIEWGQGVPLPGFATATHPIGRVELRKLVLEGDRDRLAAWLGNESLPISVRPGAPAIARIVLSGSAGEIVLAADRS